MFHHDNRVGAFGDRSAGHDFDAFRRVDDALELFTGAHLADDANAPGHVARPDREAVAHGAVEWRIIAIGRNVVSENSARRVFDRDGFPARKNAL